MPSATSDHPPSTRPMGYTPFPLHDLPHWQALAEEVKAALQERLPSNRLRKGDYFHTQAQRMEHQLIDGAVQHTLHLLSMEEDKNRIYTKFLEREVKHAADQLQRQYAHLLKPQDIDELAYMQEEGTPMKYERMHAVQSSRQRHAREKLNDFANDIEKEIQKGLQKRDITAEEIGYRFEQKGIEQPKHLPFIALTRPEAARAGAALD